MAYRLLNLMRFERRIIPYAGKSFFRFQFLLASIITDLDRHRRFRRVRVSVLASALC